MCLNCDHFWELLVTIGRLSRILRLFATPLFALLKKDSEYVWSPACNIAFEALKAALIVDPVLHVANSTGKFLLYTDWSCEAVSAILH